MTSQPADPASIETRSDAATQIVDDRAGMVHALGQAKLAIGHADVPVGAIVVWRGQVIAARHNERELTGDPTAHAEVLAIRDAAAAIGNWRLDECTMYVTLEPCPMCAGALVNARIPRVVFGASDPKAGAGGSLMNILADARLNHRCEVTGGILDVESATLLRAFFAVRRRPRLAPTDGSASANAVDQAP